jgi:hypothetical protein
MLVIKPDLRRLDNIPARGVPKWEPLPFSLPSQVLKLKVACAVPNSVAPLDYFKVVA